MTTILIILFIIFITTLIRGMTGFGNALLAMPLLAMTVGMHIATPLVGYTSVIMAVVMLARNWKHVDVKEAWQLILMSCIGVPVGLLLFTSVPEQYVKVFLGMLLVGFGVYNLFLPQLPELRWRESAYLFGFIAGVLGGAYNTNGPPVIIYGTLRHWSPERFRATLQGYFLPTCLVIFVGQGMAGLWTPDILWLFLYTLPVTVLALLVGERLYRLLPGETFRSLVYVLLVLMGVMLVVT